MIKKMEEKLTEIEQEQRRVYGKDRGRKLTTIV